MISLVPQTAPPLSHQNLSNTLRTDDLINGEFIQRDFLSDSDTSSICHSPGWDNISGRKGRNEKREKKRREKELEKRKSHKMMSTKTVVKPRKLSKMPPNNKPKSTEYSGNGIETINNSPGLQCRANVNLPTLKITSPRKSIDLGKKPHMAFSSHSICNLSQTNEVQHERGFIGGLKLRKVEEAGVQEAIRQIKTKNKDEDNLPVRQKYRVPEDYKRSTPGSTERSSFQERSEWQSRQRDNSPVQQYTASATLKHGAKTAVDYFSIPRNLNTKREQPENRTHLGNGWRRPVHDFKLGAISPRSSANLPENNQMDDRDVDSSRLQYHPYRTFNYSSDDREQKNQNSFNNLGGIVPTPELNFHESHEKIPGYQRKHKSFIHPLIGKGTLRPTTEKLYKQASETSAEPFRFPLENVESFPHHESSFSSPNSVNDTEISGNGYRRDSNSSYSDIILDYADFYNDSTMAEENLTSGKALNELCDIISSPSVMNISQKIKRSFDSSESGSRFSQTKSADFGEESSFQDGYSNITTPTESRPNSFNDGSHDTSSCLIQPAQLVDHIQLESEKKSDSVENKASKAEGQYDGTRFHSNTRTQSKTQKEAETQPSSITPLRIVKEKNHQAFSRSTRSQDMPLCTAEIHQTSSRTFNELDDEGAPLRGLIKKPKEALVSKKSVIKSKESNYSQYLQEARSRIGSNNSIPQLPRPPRDSSMPRQRAEPFAKMFVICCSCKYFHDMPSKLYACMAKPEDLVMEENLGVSGVMMTSVKCPWCEHCMSTSCCAGYAAVVYMKERLH